MEKLAKTKNKLRLYKSIVGTRKNIYFKILPIQYSKDQNQKINKKLKTLRNLIVKKKTKSTLNQNNIEEWQERLNYKAHGTIIRRKILNEE